MARGSALSQACAERGLLVLTCGAGQRRAVLIPPLNVERPEIEEALGVFQQALYATKASRPGRPGAPTVPIGSAGESDV